jgi:A/G-specific adenine glycosylase
MHAIVFAWFKKRGRDLPWRRTSDPYAIALSEIMLQQTQVDRVIPKWRAFLATFPTWNDLAKGKTSDVLRLWQGLGYNRRAVMLHRLAKAVIDRGGELPNDIEAMKKLPGIGDYTANAIAAFAFRNPGAAPVDTNISRIFRRVFPRQGADTKSMQQLARVLAPKDVWTWNHALMDIGALHCTARHHVWAECPLRELHGSKAKVEPWLGKKSAGKFEESDRFFRGRIVDALRERPLSLSALRHLTILTTLTNERFTTLVKRIENDGVIVIKNGKVYLSGDE